MRKRNCGGKGCTLQSLSISDKYDYIDRNSIYNTRTAFVNFDKLQSDTLSNINEMIVKVQEEFNKLQVSTNYSK